MDNCDIKTDWVLRLDADEYLTDELKAEMQEKLPVLGAGVSAVVLPLGRAFMGRILKHGIVNGVKMIRLFRYGKARYEQRLMDEHLEVLEGDTVTFEHKFIDDNRMPLTQFVAKLNNYSSREAAVLLDAEYGLSACVEAPGDSAHSALAAESAAKRAQKARYAKMPLFWRALGYFCYRYFFKLGFLDGKEGFCWDFFQGLWYRMLVDTKVYEAKKTCEITKSVLSDEEKVSLKRYIEQVWGIKLG